MQTDRVGKRNGNTHPMPGILLVIRCLVPVCHEQKRLHKGDAIDFVIKIIQNLRLLTLIVISGRGTYSSFLKEGFSCRFSVRISGCPEIFHIHESCSCKHDGLEKQQTNFSCFSGSIIQYLKQFVYFHQWHIRMYIFYVASQEGISHRGAWQ